MPQDPLNLLCIEPHFPGRLGGVADWLVRRRGYKCHFFCHSAGPKEFWPESTGRGMDVIAFGVGGVAREETVAWQRSLERSLCYSFGAWEVINHRRPRPIDVVLGRSDGLGSALFAPVYVPRTPVVQLFDYYYHARKNDLADGVSPDTPAAYYHWRRAANAIDLLDLENGVVPWVPTDWQRELYPAEYRDDFFVLHDGVDARSFAPRAGRPRKIAGRTIPEGTKIVSFVAKSLERLRGFDRFLTLANALVRDRADIVAVVVGDSKVARTLDVAFHGRDYREFALRNDPPPDPDRLWFLGAVTPAVVADVMACSDLHVYPSRTYPASRSLLQAMAAGRVVLASDDPPVRELIRPGVDGLLASPDDPDDWFRLASRVLDDPSAHAKLGASARDVVRERYDRDATLPRLAERLNQLAGLGG
jgi:glycosyltransferase involved in cell wall biosynthesis